MAQILTKAGCYIAIIVLGYVLRKRGFFGEGTFDVLSRIVIKLTLPAAIIASSAGKPISADMLTVSLLGLGGGVLYMLLGYLVSVKEDRAGRAFHVLNVPGYNIGTFALPFTQGFLGSTGVLITSLFDVGNSFVCLGGAYGVAAAVKEGGRFSWKRVLKGPLTSIPFLTHVVMVILNLNGWAVPGPVLSFAEILGNANAFLAMLMIGVGFRLSGDRKKLGAMVRVLAVRYSIAVLLAVGYYFLLPFDVEVRQTLALLAVSPIGSAIPVFTAELKGDVGLSSAINSVSIVISIILMVSLLMIML